MVNNLFDVTFEYVLSLNYCVKKEKVEYYLFFGRMTRRCLLDSDDNAYDIADLNVVNAFV